MTTRRQQDRVLIAFLVFTISVLVAEQAGAQTRHVNVKRNGAAVNDVQLTILAGGGLKWDSLPGAVISFPSQGGVFDQLAGKQLTAYAQECPNQATHLYFVQQGVQPPQRGAGCDQRPLGGFIFASNGDINVDLSAQPGQAVTMSSSATPAPMIGRAGWSPYWKLGADFGSGSFPRQKDTVCVDFENFAKSSGGFGSSCSFDSSGFSFGLEAWWRYHKSHGIEAGLGGGFDRSNRVDLHEKVTLGTHMWDIHGNFGSANIPYAGTQVAYPFGLGSVVADISLGFWSVPSGSTALDNGNLIDSVAQHDRGVGVRYHVGFERWVNPNLAIDFGYSYMRLKKTGADIDEPFHQFRLGGEYRFGTRK